MTGGVVAAAGPATAKGLAIGVVLVGAVVVELLACLVMPNLNDRLHYTTPASAVGPALAAVAVLARESLDHQGIVTVIVVAFLALFGPVVSHATARAARIRSAGTWRERPGETVHRP